MPHDTKPRPTPIRDPQPGRFACLPPLLSALLVLSALLAHERAIDAAEELLFPARIAFQSKPFPSFTDMEVYKAAVKKALKTKQLAPKANGDWEFHFVAFLNKRKAPRADRVNLAFFRKSRLVDFVEFTVAPAGKVLLAKASLQTSRGFAKGDLIRAKITVLKRRGKTDQEIVLADTGHTFVLR